MTTHCQHLHTQNLYLNDDSLSMFTYSKLTPQHTFVFNSLTTNDKRRRLAESNRQQVSKLVLRCSDIVGRVTGSQERHLARKNPLQESQQILYWVLAYPGVVGWLDKNQICVCVCACVWGVCVHVWGVCAFKRKKTVHNTLCRRE